MKVFVTGVNGQLGHDCINELISRGHCAVGSDITNKYSGIQDNSAVVSAQYVPLDITDENAVNKVINDVKPNVIIHCAAWTAVDAAEDESNKKKVYSINVEGTKHITEAAKRIDAAMLYLSTDYVFNGKGKLPWKPEDKNYAPLNYYGFTKLEGEKVISSTLSKFFIVRIAWAFGLNGNNFIKTMINAGKKHDVVYVVNDQIGTPTYTVDLSRLIVDMIETNKYGYYHATNEGGFISWYDLCCEAFRQYGLKTTVIPVTTSEYGLNKATRPENSRLDKSKLISMGFKPLPCWKDAVHRYLEEAHL